jgi:hypothetical protein
MNTRALIANWICATAILSPVGTIAQESPVEAIVDMPTLMAHVVQPAAFIVWGASGVVIDASGYHDLAPTTDERWEEVVNGAATLAESTNLLMLPGRVLDDKWAGYIQQLRAVSIAAWRAAEAKDAKGISAAGDTLVDLCTACHLSYGITEGYE